MPAPIAPRPTTPTLRISVTGADPRCLRGFRGWRSRSRLVARDADEQRVARAAERGRARAAGGRRSAPECARWRPTPSSCSCAPTACLVAARSSAARLAEPHAAPRGVAAYVLRRRAGRGRLGDVRASSPAGHAARQDGARDRRPRRRRGVARLPPPARLPRGDGSQQASLELASAAEAAARPGRRSTSSCSRAGRSSLRGCTRSPARRSPTSRSPNRSTPARGRVARDELDVRARRPLGRRARRDGVVVGYSTLGDYGEATGLHLMTGVRRDWRGRGVARALKLAQIEAGAPRGLTGCSPSTTRRTHRCSGSTSRSATGCIRST